MHSATFCIFNLQLFAKSACKKQTDKKIRVRYLHMQSKPLVSAGSTIVLGATVGYTGNTGNSTGPHLHIDMNKDGLNSGITSTAAINPQKFYTSITFSGKTSTLD